ncbi:MAG: DUF4838 domain-containing protein [Lentisphaeria bacterium]|nr:DUF4838 domain-containing protein [Lentisphaeria bacterium]
MKKFIVCAILLCSIAVLAAEFVFADNGKAFYTIVVPEKTSGFEEQAAKDLQYFFSKMSGAEFKIVKESAAPAKNAIYIGKTNFARKADVNADKLSAETWVIKAVGSNLILGGGHPIGSFYAVWNVLNKFDCYTLTWDQDAVPTYKTLKQKIEFEQNKPVFSGRWVSDGLQGHFNRTKAAPEVLAAYRLFKLRNWMNGRNKKTDGSWIYGPYNYTQWPTFHSLCYHYVPKKLFKTHPEYFQMDQFGKRVCPRTSVTEGSVCMSNPEVAQVALNSLRNMIKKDRTANPKEEWATVYDISTLDISPYICKCPNCVAITREEGGDPDVLGTETGLLLRFINKIATEIKKEYPDIIIRTFGYSPSRMPPKKTLPAENVLIQLTDRFTVSNPYYPLTDPLNAGQDKYLKEWASKAPNNMLWDYWHLYTAMPDTVFNALQPDMRFFREIGIGGLYLQSSGEQFRKQSFVQLTHFVAAQLMKDPDKDPKKLADIYLKYYYGPAAPCMSKIFYEICENVKKERRSQTSAVTAHWDYLTPDFVYAKYAEMKKAIAALPEDSVYSKRIKQELLAFVWYVASKPYFYEKTFRQNGITIENIIEECKLLVNEHIRRYPAQKYSDSEKRFNRKAKSILANLKRPEKFKDVPSEHFRMIAWPHFINKSKSSTFIVDDPDSIQGKAVKSNRSKEFHGVNTILPVKDPSPATRFSWSNFKAPGKVTVTLKKVAQDEKYHWYRIPGNLELRPTSYFSGHGWAFQAETSSLYTLAEGEAQDNMWNEVWFSAKFTGPAYVPGSTKENAIYVDMAVLVRNGNAPEISLVKELMLPAAPATVLPKNWIGKNAKLKHKNGKSSVTVSGRLVGPFSAVSPGDVLNLKVRTDIGNCKVNFMFYDKNKKYVGLKPYKTKGNSINNFVCKTDSLQLRKKKDIAFFRIQITPPQKNAVYTIDELEVKITKNNQ